jgi:hypothetical protein
MNHMEDTSVAMMAQALSATGKMIEAHANEKDEICRVIIQLGDAARDPSVRKAITQLWMQDGFFASVSGDGLLMVEGLNGAHPQADLMAAVSQQIKHYAMADAQQKARADMTGNYAFHPQLQTQASLTAH